MQGQVDATLFLSSIAGFIFGVLSNLVVLIPQYVDPVSMLIFGAGIVSSILGILASGGTSVVFSAIAILASLASYVYAFLGDLNDANAIVG